MFSIEGNIVDVINRNIFKGRINIEEGRIKKVESDETISSSHFILPGLIDAHVHIESSMLVPSEFARLAVVHGTVGTVSDPHEIANVMGAAGVGYMIENGNKVPFHFNFGAPSCVPATTFETSGAEMDADEVTGLLKRKEIRYLSEMMNYPGVLHHNEQVMKKIAAAKEAGKPIDGHAPGLKGDDAVKYISAGISTDHECFSYEEAKWKLKHGMKVIIREGSAAKNYEALIPLLDEFPEMIMFCSDDKHPNDLVRGHINELVKRALNDGYDFWKVIRAVTLNPVRHYNLECGLLREGDSADFIVVNDLTDFSILQTFIKGKPVAENGKSLIPRNEVSVINQFHCNLKSPADFSLEAKGKKIRVIEAFDGQLITGEKVADVKTENGLAVTDLQNDVLKFTVVNRYADSKPAVAFIANFGLKEGAIASCVGHDSHNILAVGANDDMICRAVNLIIKNKGGLSAVTENEELVLSLPIGGIMSDRDGWQVAEAYEKLDQRAKEMGSKLSAPYMTLSFMALLVIPQLKLSDKGLFDGSRFQFTELFC